MASSGGAGAAWAAAQMPLLPQESPPGQMHSPMGTSTTPPSSNRSVKESLGTW